MPRYTIPAVPATPTFPGTVPSILTSDADVFRPGTRIMGQLANGSPPSVPLVVLGVDSVDWIATANGNPVTNVLLRVAPLAT